MVLGVKLAKKVHNDAQQFASPLENSVKIPARIWSMEYAGFITKVYK